ncbi:hypothetical protein [Brevundimonas sp. TWP2-3-4b2]|uniref:hypothetical protein n=1 Tax=Brevundimonas sp. TWP2-3-4b2 TaxID=2804595 RepID=UPI003CF4A115
MARDGAVWTLNYSLHQDSAVWAFPVSAVRRQTRQPWRPSEWTVQTGNVVLRREGDYDIITTTDGGPVPRTIRIRMTPVGGSLDREYDPAIPFSNGAVALYSEQFDIAPVGSIEALRSSETVSMLESVVVPVTYTDAAGPVLVNGERAVTGSSMTTPTYVVFGPGETEAGSGAAILADPALPAWIRGELLDYMPKVLDGYTRRLGPRLNADPPTMIASWNGPTLGKVDMSGGVRPGLILLAFEGEGVLDREPRTLARARWFIAHEAAHFWLGSSGVAS